MKTLYVAKLEFQCTDNIVEYKAILLGRKLKTMGVKSVILKSDSQVIIGHIDKSSKARSPALEKYLDTVQRIEESFEGFSFKHIPRANNEHVDMLANSVA
jgi:ribonuclease HI